MKNHVAFCFHVPQSCSCLCCDTIVCSFGPRHFTNLHGMVLRRICVFCGSSTGLKAEFVNAAEALGTKLACRNIGLIYGGGSVGLMGVVSQSAHNQGGAVIGVIPEQLKPIEISGETRGEVIVTKDMHERKQHMSSLADAFIAMPGGFGTLEELFEMITWKQLGFHSKPVGILNVDGFYDALLKFLDESVSLGFISKSARELLFVAESPDELLNKLSSFSSE